MRVMAQEAACSAATAWGCRPGAYWASLFCPQLALAGIELGPSCHHLSRSVQGLEVTGYSVGLHGLLTSSCNFQSGFNHAVCVQINASVNPSAQHRWGRATVVEVGVEWESAPPPFNRPWASGTLPRAWQGIIKPRRVSRLRLWN